MPDQTKTTDEQRIPDRIVQDVLSASLEPTKVTHIEGTAEMVSSISTEKPNDHDEYFDVESETPNEILPTEKPPPITLAKAEKLQHDAAIEQKEDDFYEAQVELAPINVSATVKHFNSMENQANSLLFLSSTKKNDTIKVSAEKSPNKKEETTVSDKKPKSINKKKTNGVCSPVGKNEERVTVEKSNGIDKQKLIETTTSDKRTTKPDDQINTSHELEKLKSSEGNTSESQNISNKKKQEPIVIEKPIPVEFIDQKQTNKVHSPKTLPKNETPIEISQESLRPKFSLRLKPTITVNHDDKLQLKVQFIGQPEPEVKITIFSYYNSLFLFR